MSKLVPLIHKNNSLSQEIQSELIKIQKSSSLIEASYSKPMGEIKREFTDLINSEGYITNYNIHKDHRLSIDGIKKDLAIQVQLGNAARFYADIMKLEYLYRSKKIKEAIYICFTANFIYNHFSGNIISIERAQSELQLFNNIITVPIGFISIDITG
mgnify:CR=1 FL=1